MCAGDELAVGATEGGARGAWSSRSGIRSARRPDRGHHHRRGGYPREEGQQQLLQHRGRVSLIAARGRVRREEGAAAVEFALVGSVLILILFGILVYGLWLSEYSVMQGAAREGARVAATRG